jgi:hypothetical protein
VVSFFSLPLAVDADNIRNRYQPASKGRRISVGENLEKKPRDFLQHGKALLDRSGRGAVVTPDNVLL